METRVLPPSGRDFDAYRLVQCEYKSTREAAAELGISQTLVRRLVDRVGEFLAEVVPPVADKNDEGRRRRLNVAEQVAAERVQFLGREAYCKWRESKGMQTTVRQIGNEPPVTSVRQSEGEPRYLLAAARLSLVSAKLPVSMLESYLRCEDEEVENPPEEVCSAGAMAEEVTTAETLTEEVVKPVVDQACAAATDASDSPKSENARCAQSPPPAGSAATAQQSGSMVTVPMTRRERKQEKRKQKARQKSVGQSSV